MKKLFLLLFIPFIVFQAKSQTGSQILPRENSKLNYTIIGFSFPPVSKVNSYTIEIAQGNYNTESSFKKNIIRSLNTNTNRMVAKVPSFGIQYTWRIVYHDNQPSGSSSALHHFSTKTSPNIDTNNVRLRILKTAEKYKDAYVFFDESRVLYDMEGNPVWFLPDLDSSVNENCLPRDIKITPQGTITFLVTDKGYEINYNCDILWTTPHNGKVSGDSIEHCHHEFTRLGNGHYMVLGYETASEFLTNTPSDESGLFVFSESSLTPGNMTGNISDVLQKTRFYRKQQYGTVIEYDHAGNTVWSYRSSGYFNRSDLFFHKEETGMPNTKVHDNGFYFDETAKMLYMSFKDISRVIKIKYPEGTTVDTYGELFNPGAVQNRGYGLFCGQHSARSSAKGYLYMLNNNACNWPALPTVIMMQQPVSGNDSLKKIWEYQCTVDDMDQKDKANLHLTSGGNVLELPDNSLFVSTGSMYSKTFIVTMDKKILWSALPEKWNSTEHKWEPLTQYRASIINNQKDLEHLIWNEEIEKTTF